MVKSRCIKSMEVTQMKSHLITMSALTGRPSKEEIFEYLKMLKRNGISQCMIYPRSGCEIKYLSTEWFDTIGNFINSAKTLNIHLWLYDDFNWPSGNADGRVTMNEKYRLKSICTSGEKLGEINYYSQYTGSLFGETYFPNLLSEEAVDCFINCTHEKYFEKFGEYFGNVILGIFTDEPSIGYCCTKNSIPYYDEIENDYNNFCGRSFLDDMRNGYEDFYGTAMQIISDKFNTCFITKLSNWCKEHNIIMTGHLMGDNNPVVAARHNGNLLKNLSSFMLPGIDEIRTNLKDKTLLNLLSVAEYARGEYGAMAELFALGPCDMTYAKKRCMIFLAACFKINNYFLAISHMDMRGNLKISDYFNNFADDQPDFEGTKLLAKDSEIAAAYADKDYVPDVYIRYPFDVLAKKITSDIDIQPFIELINKLSYHQLQWKYIDAEEISNNIPVIDFTEKLEYICNGEIISNADTICRMLNPKVYVTTPEGELPEGIFIRRFSENSFIVLNLYGKSGIYKINGKDYFLDEHGVFISDENKEIPHCKEEKISAVFDVCYFNANMIRTMYINSESRAELLCSEPTDVIFAVRKDTEAYLNEEKINTGSTYNSILSAGMRNLYNTSEKFTLKNNMNIIKSQNDCKYLPSVFIIGDFSANTESKDICRINLTPRRKVYVPGEKFCDFGKIGFCTNIRVPFGVKAVTFKGTKLYSRLYIDDILIGEKICSPYTYMVDESLWDKTVTLKIVQYSSMAPIFGDVGFYEKTSENVKWKGTPSTNETILGFDEVNWLF